MSIQTATQKVVDALNAAEMPYMLTGSLASMFYSFPRSTADADFVVKLSKGDMDSAVLELGEGGKLGTDLRAHQPFHDWRIHDPFRRLADNRVSFDGSIS